MDYRKCRHIIFAMSKIKSYTAFMIVPSLLRNMLKYKPTIEGLINEMIKFFQTKSLENATPLQKVYIQCRRLILQQYQLGKMIYTKDPPIKQIIEEFEPIIITRYSSIDVFSDYCFGGINHYSKKSGKITSNH